jgi:integrase
MLCYRSADGSQHQTSSRIPAQARYYSKAVRMAEEAEEASRKLANPQLEKIDRQIHAHQFSQKIMGIHGQTLPQPTMTPLTELIGRWLESKQLCRAPKTFVRYKQVAKDFTTFIGSVKVKYPPSYIMPQDIQDFVFHCSRKGDSKSSCAVKVKILRNLFNMGRRQGMNPNNPAEAIETPSGVRMARVPFTVEELKAILAVANNDWKAMTLLGGYAAMRLKDAASLTWRNVDLEQKIITYLPLKKARLPNATKVRFPIHPRLLDGLLQIPVDSRSPDAPLFPNLINLPTSGKTGLSGRFLSLLQKARIDTMPTKRPGSRMFQAKTFHSLRHTCISLMANSGVSQELRKELAGHSSDVHRQYTHHSPSVLRSAVEAMPDLF